MPSRNRPYRARRLPRPAPPSAHDLHGGWQGAFDLVLGRVERLQGQIDEMNERLAALQETVSRLGRRTGTR